MKQLLILFLVFCHTGTALALPKTQEPNQKLLRIQLVTAAGNPVYGSITLRATNANELRNEKVGFDTDSRLLVGKSHRTTRDFLIGSTDSKGIFELAMPGTLQDISITGSSHSHGIVKKKWNSKDGVQRLVLQPIKFAGCIVNESGDPIVNATITQMPLSKRPSVSQKREIKTDELGSWEFDSSNSNPNIIVSHPDYCSGQFELGDPYLKREQPKPIVLVEGRKIFGTVVDEANQPIANAKLFVAGRFDNSYIKTNPKRKSSSTAYRSQVATNEIGEFAFHCGTIGTIRVVAVAHGFAVEVKRQTMGNGETEINFQLKKTSPTEIRVVDQDNQAIVGCDVQLDGWTAPMGGLSVPLHGVTDKEGKWVCHSSPGEMFVMRADPSLGTTFRSVRSVPLSAGQSTTIVLPKTQNVFGTVLNHETGEKIERFWTTTHTAFDDPSLATKSDKAQRSVDGSINLSRLTTKSARVIFEINAPGFQSEFTEVYPADLETIEFTAKLKPSKESAVSIMQPDGKPAAGASISIGSIDSSFTIRKGVLRNLSTRDFYTADESATFTMSFRTKRKVPLLAEPFPFKPQNAMFVHKTGYAYFVISDKEDDQTRYGSNCVQQLPKQIKLKPWNKIVADICTLPDKKSRRTISTMASFAEPLRFSKPAGLCVSNGFVVDGKYHFEFVPDISTSLSVSTKSKGVIQYGFMPGLVQGQEIKVGHDQVSVKGKFKVAENFQPRREIRNPFLLSSVTAIDFELPSQEFRLQQFLGTPRFDRWYRQLENPQLIFSLAMNVVGQNGEFVLHNVQPGKNMLIFTSSSQEEFVFEIDVQKDEDDKVIDLGEFELSEDSKREKS